MRQMKIFVAGTAVAFALTVSVAFAQQPTHQHDAGQQPPASAPGAGMSGRGHDVHHAQHMEMCQQMMAQGGMMGGGMGPGMMGGMMPMMMGGDRRQQADMMAMRGEMMKAMGEIILKYAQRAQPAR
jgi:hypothetical protein